MSDKQLVTFVDGVGRTIVGELVKETKTTMDLKNPAILHVQPNAQTGQIQVQLIPFFFKEFSKDGVDDSVSWEFLKANVVRAKNLQLDDRLKTQYTNMYSVIQSPNSPELITAGVGAGDAPVVKLFDD
jgi:hypothetical protein